MDDDDFMFDDDGDNGDFASGEEFAFDDDDDENGGAEDGPVEMEETPENLYYQSKNTEEENPSETATLLRKVIELDEQDRSEYGFKALKRLVKIMLKEKIEGSTSEIIKDFKSMLLYADVVSVNVMEKGINAVIDLAASIKKVDPIEASRNLELIEELSTLSAECFQRNKNERAWFRANLKLAQLLFDAGQTELLPNKLQRLTEWCELAPGVNNPKRESFLLDVIALRMKLQMQGSVTNCMSGPNGLRRLASRARDMQSTVPHPRTLGTIHECDGKVMLFEHDWPNAKKEFFQAFKNYDESGSDRRVLCLRYIVLSALLENTTVSPFETPETKSLVTNKNLVPVVKLWNAFEELDVDKFNEAISNAYAGDQFATSFLPVVKRRFQLQKIKKVVSAYSKVKIPFVAKELQLDDNECEAILAEFIIDGYLHGSIDQVNGVLLMDEEVGISPNMKYDALNKWSRHVEEVTTAISKKVIKKQSD